ncbi:fimbria/pilus chaperone family protein [Buttiauxella sp.]|uniref:fimbria/pilus chaperone family protein n=1 Tax=Buttiauxella sp. TaxID=1972222 RepID=UPI003C7086FC
MKYSSVMIASLLSMTGFVHASGMVPATSALLVNEADGGASISVKNTDAKAALLYTTVKEVDEKDKSSVRLIATQPISRLEAGQTQKVRFVLNTTAPLTVEHYKRVSFEGIPQTKAPGKMQITATIRQTLPVIIHPKGLAVSTEPWTKLEWAVSGKKVTVKNPSPYVVRLSSEVTMMPSKAAGKLPKTWILPGETLQIDLNSASSDKQLQISPVSRFGLDAGVYTANVKS